MTGDIRLNVVNGRMRESAGPKATTKVTYGGNLDANGEGLGTILHTNRFLATVRSTLPNPLQPLLETKLTSLNDENGNHLGIRSGDIFTICVTNPADGTVTTLEYEVSSATTLHDLLQQVESVLQSFDPGISVSLQPDGTVLVDMDSAQTGVSLSDLTFRTNRPISDPQVADLFSWPATLINQAESGSHYASLGGVRRPAEEDDLLSEVFDAAGRPLGLEGGAAPGSSGDRICINGSVGGRGISYGEKIVYSSEITIGDLMQHIRAAFRLPAYTEPGGTVRSVDFAPRGSSRFPDGAIVIRGLPGYEFAIESISITATNDNNNAQAPNAFISNCAMTEVQAARSPETHASAITVYDSSGYEHTMITTFTHAGNPGEWIWRIHMADDEAVVAGGEGMLVFGVDGTPLKMSYDDGANGFRYRSEHTPGAAPIRLDMGASGSLKGITQFRVPSNAAAAVQDGYARGFMVEMSITQRGTITGIYSNGLNRALYQIVLAQFLNPSFLDRKGRYYVPNEKSGPAVVLTPETTGAKLRIGTLEADTE
jgi:flagellar hook protein FlgE